MAKSGVCKKRMKEERLILGSVVRQQNKAKEIQATLPEEKSGGYYG